MLCFDVVRWHEIVQTGCEELMSLLPISLCRFFVQHSWQILSRLVCHTLVA